MLKDELVKVIDKLLLYELDTISELDRKSVNILAQAISGYKKWFMEIVGEDSEERVNFEENNYAAGYNTAKQEIREKLNDKS